MIVFQLQTTSAHKKVGVRRHICPSLYSYIQQRPWKLWCYADVVNLISGNVVGRNARCLVLLWGKTLPPMTGLLKEGKSTNSSLFSFIFPIPSFLMAVSKLVFSLPTLALRSPSNNNRSFLATPSMRHSNLSQKAAFASSSVSFVDA